MKTKQGEKFLFSLKFRLLLIGVLILLSSSLILFQFVIPLITKGKVEERELKLKAVVDSAISLMSFYEKGARNAAYSADSTNGADALKSIEDLKRAVSDEIEQIRYDKTEYLFILDRSGSMVMHPTKPELKGKNMLEESNNNGTKPFFEMVTCAQQEGGCFVKYTWQSKWSNTVFEPYTTYCSYYWPWEWIVCSGVRTQDIVDATKQNTIQVSIYFALISLITSLLLYSISLVIIRPILRLSEKVKNLDTNVNNQTYEEIKNISNDEVGVLTASFNEMAVGLQKSRSNLKNVNRELAEEKAKLIASINGLSLGFLIADTKDRILIRNPAIMRILEVSGEPSLLQEIVEPFKDVSGEIDVLTRSCHDCMELRKIIELNNIPYRKKFLRIFCTPIFAQVISSTSEERELIGYAMLVEDITEARILERSREEFFAVASHELRTPLTAIRGNTDMLLGMFRDKAENKDAQEMLGDISASSIRLIDVVNDFLEASRLEQGKIDFKKENFSLSEVVDKVIRDLSTTVTAKGLVLSYSASVPSIPLVYADRNRTEQILLNLVGNALKFTRQGSITITNKVSNGFAEIRVVDTGAGISDHNQALLFRKFQQAGEDMLARDVTQSTGLGLYISRLIVEGMGGTIGLEESILGKGSTFVFRIPLAPTNGVAIAPSQNSA